MKMQRRKRQKSSLTTTASHYKQRADTSKATSTNVVDYMQYFVHLLHVGQMLYGQTQGVADRLCQEIAQATQGHCQLFLHYSESSDRTQTPSPTLSISFPVHFRELIYGTLYVALDPAHPTSPLIPRTVANSLAQMCGWLLHFLEVSAFLEGQYQRLEHHQVHGTLTKRERDVLTLICRSYKQAEIAKALSITPTTVDKHRQRIYDKLNVHSEHDTLLAAFQAGLFSPIEGISSIRSG